MSKIIAIVLSLMIMCNCKPKQAPNSNDSISNKEVFVPFVERIDPGLDKIISKDSKVEILAEGFDWVEGPLWIDGIGLLFSDIPVNKVYKWDEKEGVSLYVSPSGYTGTSTRGGELGSNALFLDEEKNLLLCQHGDRRIAKMTASIEDPKAEYVTLIDNYKGKKLNSPNDACISKEGAIYFTDPPYGLENRMEDPLKELDFQGVYKYTSNGDLELLTRKLSRPNGIAFSPDEKTLYVANSDPQKAIWMAYDLNAEGKIQEGRVFYDVTSYVDKEAGLPDGMKVMPNNGTIFAAGPGGVWIFDASGKVLGKIKTGQATSNCAFGNDDKVLYITADMFVMKVNLIL